MMRAIAACAVVALAAHSATAQDTPPRQIAPDRFYPYSGALLPHESATAIIAPTREQPFGACDPRAHDWVPCLTATARKSDGIVEQAEQDVRDAVTQRRKLNPSLRKAYGDALSRLDAEWRKFRDSECDALAALEQGLPTQVYEARQTCRILRNLERAEALRARYLGE
jgi:uncharacterized protein YecT (DUF1311 family)